MTWKIGDVVWSAEPKWDEFDDQCVVTEDLFVRLVVIQNQRGDMVSVEMDGTGGDLDERTVESRFGVPTCAGKDIADAAYRYAADCRARAHALQREAAAFERFGHTRG